MVRPQLALEHCLCDLQVAQRLLASSQDEHAAAQVVESGRSVDGLDAQQPLPDRPSPQKTTERHFVVLEVVQH